MQRAASDARADVQRPIGTTRRLRQAESLRAVIESIGGEPDLRPLLTRVLCLACELIRADDGAIGIVDEARGVVRTEAVYRMPADELGSEMAAGVGLAGQVLQRGEMVRVRRYGELPNPTQPSLVDQPVIGVPIRWNDRVIGVFGLGRAPRRRVFTAHDANSLAVFAGHAAIAIENARRFARERQRTERLALLARVGRLVTAGLHADELLQRAADAIHELLGYENVAIALIGSDDPETMVLASFGGAYKQIIGGRHRIPITQGIMGAAARSREAVLVNDVTSDPRYLPTPGIEGIRSELAVPILLGGRVLGVLNVESSTAFTEEDANSLRAVADQLAVALENVRLYEAAQGAAVLEERHRLASHLHDSVTQLLVSATLVAQTVGPAYARDAGDGDRRARALLDLARSALGEMRALLDELRPLGRRDTSATDDTPRNEQQRAITRVARDGLATALRDHAATVEVTGLRITVVDDGYVAQPLAREEAMYRVAQEALHNVVKHAQAMHVEVRLRAASGRVGLAVRDDGVGIAGARAARAVHTELAPGASGGLGLVVMRERVAAHGGVLRVESTAGHGTIVAVDFPQQTETPP